MANKAISIHYKMRTGTPSEDSSAEWIGKTYGSTPKTPDLIATVTGFISYISGLAAKASTEVRRISRWLAGPLAYGLTVGGLCVIGLFCRDLLK